MHLVDREEPDIGLAGTSKVNIMDDRVEETMRSVLGDEYEAVLEMLEAMDDISKPSEQLEAVKKIMEGRADGKRV